MYSLRRITYSTSAKWLQTAGLITCRPWFICLKVLWYSMEVMACRCPDNITTLGNDRMKLLWNNYIGWALQQKNYDHDSRRKVSCASRARGTQHTSTSYDRDLARYLTLLRLTTPTTLKKGCALINGWKPVRSKRQLDRASSISNRLNPHIRCRQNWLEWCEQSG